MPSQARYHPITALLLMISVPASVFVMQQLWFLLLGSMTNSAIYLSPNTNTLTIMSLILTAVCLVWLILIWQYLRFKHKYSIKHRQNQMYALHTLQDYLAFHPMRLSTFLYLLGVLLVSIFLSSYLIAIFYHRFQIIPSEDAGRFIDSQTPMWLFALLVLICAPIYEELICRGLFWRLGQDLFGFLGSQTGIIIATSLLSSIIFVLLHFQYDYPKLLALLVVSLVLCYARQCTHSLFAPMILHSINNSLVLLLG